MNAPFARTSCDCPDCSAHCRRQPGPLAPGDRELIAAHLQMDVESLDRLALVASPGALALDLTSGQVVRIGTITPRRMPDGTCVFLTREGRCAVHSVAPAGCAYFDSHMSASEGQRRSAYLHGLIHADASYAERRAALAANL